MIKKLTLKTFTFERIIKHFQDTEFLWDYCAALRGPDLELSDDGSAIKSVFTVPLRGFRLDYALCLSETPLANRKVIGVLVKVFTIKNFRIMHKNKITYNHYFHHIYLAWEAIQKILRDSKQRKLIHQFKFDIAIIHDYFDPDGGRGINLTNLEKVSAKQARDAVLNYEKLLAEFLKTIIRK